MKHDPLVLFPHQEQGVAWMLNREECSKCAGGLLLDDCGVGKTPQVIATLARNPQKLTLIVAPVNILSQWQAQLHRWLPDFKVLLYHKSSLVNTLRKVADQSNQENAIYQELYRQAKTAAEDHAAAAAGPSSLAVEMLVQNPHQTFSSEAPRPQERQGRKVHPLVVVTSYGKLVNRTYEKRRARYKRMGLLDDRYKTGATPLSVLSWGRVVLDECHLIRNHNTTRTRYVLALKAHIRWGLTATPIHNGMQDYQCLLRFLGLKKWEIAHVFASHPALEKYLTDKARKEASGKILDFSDGIDGKARILSKDNPRLTHEELTLRRTKNQVFSKPPRKRGRDDDDDSFREQKKKKSSPELPELTLDIVRVDFATQEEEDFYRRLEQAIHLQVYQAVEGQDDEAEITDQALFELILRLRQASVNPALVVSGYRRKFRGQFPVNLVGGETLPQHVVVAPGASVMTRGQRRRWLQREREDQMMRAIGVPSKTRVLQKMLLEHYRDEKAIIFCEFREEMPHLQRDLASVGVSTVLYDGSLTLTARAEIVKRMSWTYAEIENFLAHVFPGLVPPEIVDMISRYVSYDAIIVQIQSGNAGLNLQMCSRVYYTNPNWNPCTEIQAWGRAHRLGQTREVAVTKLILSGNGPSGKHNVPPTVDQRVLDVQAAKRAVMADILDDEDILFNGTDTAQRGLTTEDLLHMVG